MNRNAKKQHHEQARKKHRHQQQEHAREAAKRKRSSMPFWVMAIGIGGLVVFLLAVTFAR